MEVESRKIAVVMVAVAAYMKAEKSGHFDDNGAGDRAAPSGWALAGRREMMDMRRACQLRLVPRRGSPHASSVKNI